MTDRGSAPIELTAGIALLLLPIALAVLVAPSWVGTRSAARAAAGTAARVIATGPGTSFSEAAAVAAALEAVSSYGYDEADVRLCPGRGGSCLPLVRGAFLDVEVSVLAPAVEIPGVGSFGEVWVRSRASARVDPYRSLP